MEAVDAELVSRALETLLASVSEEEESPRWAVSMTRRRS